MPLAWSEIRSRAFAFSREYAEAVKENAESQSFWNDFFYVFGLNRRRVASFEKGVNKLVGASGRIDCFWPGVLMIEQKSRGRDLDAAAQQAFDYFHGLDEKQLPKYVLVSDFARFELRNLDSGATTSFALDALSDHIQDFAFIAGYEVRAVHEQDPVNQEAAVQMGRLHDLLRAAGYRAPDLDKFLVRLLFCLFADDTGIFERGSFEFYLDTFTSVDGRDLGMHLHQVFEVLDTPPTQRQGYLDEELAKFPYVNGGLFAGGLRTAAFDARMREVLLEVCRLDWGKVSPAIFGSMFQAAMDPEERRELGAHFTSEANIMKLLGPLFLDELRAEAEGFIRADRGRTGMAGRTQLKGAMTKLASYTFLDPACGSGNFLIIAYRELRRLELELVVADLRRSGQRLEVFAEADLDVGQFLKCSVNQFFGFEYESFAARVAETALWLVDHQMNLEASARFGKYLPRIPIVSSPHIVNGNALTLDWTTAFGESQPGSFSFILGNPPFVGAKYQSVAQRVDLRQNLKDVRSAGLLDYVTGWFVKSARYVAKHPNCRVGFVSTNSIAQGEQVGVLWEALFGLGMQLHFAHRTFAWHNEAAGKAAVHVVIEGFGIPNENKKRLFSYLDIKGKPLETIVSNINPYLVEGPDVAITRRSKPICEVPEMLSGNKPIDGGHYLFTAEEKQSFVQLEPLSEPYFRRWYGAQEFLNGIERWCLWLGDVLPQNLRAMPHAMERVEAVRNSRSKSPSAPTKKLARTPTRFHVEVFPPEPYLVIPEVSSERRRFIPLGYMQPDEIASNKLRVLAGTGLYGLGVLSSTMHNAWIRYVSGRLKSDYQYSVTVVYNNFPWPKPTKRQRTAIEAAAEAMLTARAPFLASGATLADLYDPRSMPPVLAKAHNALDKAVDLAYRPQAFVDERRRVEYLFDTWGRLVEVK